MIDAQRLECALETVKQVVGQADATDHVNDNGNWVGKNEDHFIEQGRTGYFLDIVCEARNHPEMFEVHHQENQQKATKDTHATRVPFAVGVARASAVFGVAFLGVVGGKAQALGDVQDQSEEQSNFRGTNEPVVSHEFCCMVECFATVVEENTGVDTSVDQQKSHQG